MEDDIVKVCQETKLKEVEKPIPKGDEVLIKFPDTNDTLSAKINYSSRAISAMNRTFSVEILLNNTKEYHPNQNYL